MHSVNNMFTLVKRTARINAPYSCGLLATISVAHVA